MRSREDPLEALAMLDDMREGSKKYQAEFKVIEALVRVDPEKAIDAIEALPPSRRLSYEHSLASEFGKLPNALDFIDRFSVNGRDDLVYEAGFNSSTGDRAEMLAKSAELDGRAGRRMKEGIFLRWSLDDPDQFAQHVRSSVDASDTDAPLLIRHYSNSNPTEALDLLIDNQQQLAEIEDVSDDLGSVVMNALNQNPSRVFDRRHDIVDDAMRDYLLGNLVTRAIADGRLEEARALHQEVSSPVVRDSLNAYFDGNGAPPVEVPVRRDQP